MLNRSVNQLISYAMLEKLLVIVVPLILSLRECGIIFESGQYKL